MIDRNDIERWLGDFNQAKRMVSRGDYDEKLLMGRMNDGIYLVTLVESLMTLEEPDGVLERAKSRQSKTEPQTSCKTCRFGEVDEGYVRCAYYSKATEKDEPQTMLNDGTLVINVEDATKVSRVLVGDDKNRGGLYYLDDEDEPQTDCAWR